MHSNTTSLSCYKSSSYYSLLIALHDDPAECDVSYRQLKILWVAWVFLRWPRNSYVCFWF